MLALKGEEKSINRYMRARCSDLIVGLCRATWILFLHTCAHVCTTTDNLMCKVMLEKERKKKVLFAASSLKVSPGLKNKC